MQLLIIVLGFMFLAFIFNEINRPRPAEDYGYGPFEYLVIWALTFILMIVVFLFVVSIAGGG